MYLHWLLYKRGYSHIFLVTDLKDIKTLLQGLSWIILFSSEETQQSLNHLLKPKTKYNDRHPKQIAAHDALVNFIANDLMPLSLVESEPFRKFVTILDPQYHLPSRKHFSQVMQIHYPQKGSAE